MKTHESAGSPVVASSSPDRDREVVTYLDSIHDALADALRTDERVFLLGEDIGHFGGPFGVTKGLLAEFGPERVIDTPISEEAIVGAAIGAAWLGDRPIVELQFADFVSCAFDPIVTVAAKTHWRSGLALPLVVRAPAGAGVHGGPFHSASPEGWFVGEPGLKVIYPGTVTDAYGLLRTAIDDEDPVLFFEHKRLYRSLRAHRVDPSFRVPIGQASVVRSGADATLVTYGGGLTTALAVVEQAGANVEVIDLRTLWPLDAETVLRSLERTSRLLVLQEAPGSAGVAHHLLSLAATDGFELLDAPPKLVAPPDVPVPFAPQLEQAYLPGPEAVAFALEELLAY